MKKIMLVLSLSFIILGACSTNTNGNADSNSKKEEKRTSLTSSKSGDVREETNSIDVLPEFLNNKPKNVKNLYKIAAQNKELLESIPCYCGCGKSAGHKNNYDCFVYKNNKDGSVVWDDHGTKCDVCLKIADRSISKSKEGKTVKEIRKMIDKEYKEGYADPTPTPVS